MIINRPRIATDKIWHRIGWEHLPIAFNLNLDIKTEWEQPPNHIKQPLETPNTSHSKWEKWEKLRNEWLIPNSFKITPRRSLDFQGIKKHQKTYFRTSLDGRVFWVKGKRCHDHKGTTLQIDKIWHWIGWEHLPIAFNLNLNIKTEAEQPPNHIKQPTGDPKHQPLKMRKMRKNEKNWKMNQWSQIHWKSLPGGPWTFSIKFHQKTYSWTSLDGRVFWIKGKRCRDHKVTFSKNDIE